MAQFYNKKIKKTIVVVLLFHKKKYFDCLVPLEKDETKRNEISMLMIFDNLCLWRRTCTIGYWLTWPYVTADPRWKVNVELFFIGLPGANNVCKARSQTWFRLGFPQCENDFVLTTSFQAEFLRVKIVYPRYNFSNLNPHFLGGTADQLQVKLKFTSPFRVRGMRCQLAKT